MSEHNGNSSQPHSEETERVVLGSVMLDNRLAAIVTSELTDEDFYSLVHRNAFAALKAMHERDATEEINPISLAEAMRRAGSYVEGMMPEISNLNYGLPSISANTLTKQYIPTLRQHTALRQLLRFCARTDERIRQGGESSDEVLAVASAQLEGIKKRANFGAAALRVECMADIEPETVTWLWFPFIPTSKLTIMEGDGGIGKSWLTCAIASAISRGFGLPTSEPFEAGNVLFLSAEDGLGDTLRPRLDAGGADVSRIYALAEPLTLDAIGLLKLENAIIKYAPALVVIDPLFAFTGGKVDIHRANEARTITAPLAAIAERHGCAIVAVRHLNKSHGGGNANNAGLGSIDFHAAARSVLLVGKDPDDESKRALCQTKSNLAAFGEPQGYTIEGGQFRWTGTSDLTAGRVLSFASDIDERDAQAKAVEFLRAALKDGARPAKEVKAEAVQAGLTEQNLRTARARLKIKPTKEGGEFGGKGAKWMWKMPDTQDVEEKGDQHLVVNDADKGSCDNGLTQDVADGLTNGLCDASQHLEATKGGSGPRTRLMRRNAAALAEQES
jgi:DNA repair protein RadA/Sms